MSVGIVIVFVVVAFVIAMFVVVAWKTNRSPEEADFTQGNGADATIAPELTSHSSSEGPHVAISGDESPTPPIREEEPAVEPRKAPADQPLGVVAGSTRDVLTRRVGRSRVPLVVPLAWGLAVLLCMGAGWAINFNWPPRAWLEATEKVPLSATQSADDKSSKKATKMTAKERRAAKRKAEKRHRREVRMALAKYQHPVRISVWILILVIPPFLLAFSLIVRGLRAIEMQRQRERFSELF